MRRQSVFFLARHFAEGSLLAVRLEQGVVAETPIAARRPYQRAGDARLELLDLAIRPGQAQRRNKLRAAMFRRRYAPRPQLLLDYFHGATEVPIGPRPARRVNSGR